MYWATGILGVLFIVAPYILGYAANPAALWTSIILGAVVVLDSIFEAFAGDKDMREYWAAVVFGLLAVIAPFILGFTAQAVATWTSVLMGGLIAIFAGTKLYSNT